MNMKFLTVNLFPEVYLKVSFTIDDYEEDRKSLELDPLNKNEVDEDMLGFTNKIYADSGKLVQLVYIKGSNPVNIVLGSLVHESVHVAQNYLIHIGEVSPAKEEQAYIVQGIFESLYEKYQKFLNEKSLD